MICLAHQPFGHLTTRGIARAKHQESFRLHVEAAFSAGNQSRMRLHAAQTESARF
jgi:hypothetical protein